MPHCKELPIPEPPVLESSFNVSISCKKDTDADFDKAGTTKEPHFPDQQEVDDFIRDMGLTKKNAELLISRLKEWHLLDSSCKVSKYGKCHLRFALFLPFHNLILFAIAQTYLNFLIKLGYITTPQIGAC